MGGNSGMTCWPCIHPDTWGMGHYLRQIVCGAAVFSRLGAGCYSLKGLHAMLAHFLL